MKRVLDMLVVVSGTVGLGVITLATPKMTPLNVDVYMARALLILAGVIISFLMARSLEKLDLHWPTIRLVPRRTRDAPSETAENARHSPQHQAAQPSGVYRDAQKLAPESVPTPYFDYLFQLDAPSASTKAQSRKKSRGDAHLSPR